MYSLILLHKETPFSFPSFCQRVDLSLKTSMPWLVLAGSGGLADFLSDLLENLSSAPAAQSSGEGDGEAGPSVDLKDRVAELVRKHFPSEAESDKLVEQVSAVDREVYVCVDVQNRKKLYIQLSNTYIHDLRRFQMLFFAAP